MLRAFASAILSVSVLFRWVVPHHEVALIPVGCVIVDISVVHMFQIVLNTDIEEAITVRRYDTTLLTMLHIPTIISVAPLSNETFSAPWVPQQEESRTVGQL